MLSPIDGAECFWYLKDPPVTHKKAGLTWLAVKPTSYSICQSVVMQVNNCCLGENEAIGAYIENLTEVNMTLWDLESTQNLLSYEIYLPNLFSDNLCEVWQYSTVAQEISRLACLIQCHIVCYCLRDRRPKGQNNLNFWIGLIAVHLTFDISITAPRTQLCSNLMDLIAFPLLANVLKFRNALSRWFCLHLQIPISCRLSPF